MIIVSDSSPLISLAILRKLHLLEQLFDEIWIPKAVHDEVARQNKAYSDELKQFSEHRIKKVQNVLAVRLLLQELDIGEAEAVVLALENSIQDILIDEYRGRRLAEARGLAVIGTVGVLLQAKRTNLIQAVKPELDELMLHHRRISVELYKKALELAEEN
jgi:predicted nucleic acid-binding protein